MSYFKVIVRKQKLLILTIIQSIWRHCFSLYLSFQFYDVTSGVVQHVFFLNFLFGARDIFVQRKGNKNKNKKFYLSIVEYTSKVLKFIVKVKTTIEGRASLKAEARWWPPLENYNMNDTGRTTQHKQINILVSVINIPVVMGKTSFSKYH